MMRTKREHAVVCAVVLAGIGLASLASVAQEKKPTAPATSAATVKPALTVSVTKAQSQESAVITSANGSIAAWQEVVVGAQVVGLRLDQVSVNVGDTVKRGQVLARFGAESVQAEIAASRASIAEAQAAIAEAQFNAERAKTLEASGAISAQQINQFNSNLALSKARLDAARARLKSDEIRLKNTTVLAPDSGIVSARLGTIGIVAQPGQELFRLIRQGKVEWRAEVLSAEINRLAVGQNVAVVLPTGATLEGKVRLISPTVDSQTRNVLVYVDIPSGAAKPGMFARGSFETGRSNAVTLPQTAVLTRDGFNYVFVLNGAKVSQVKVTIGRRLGERIEVMQGLPANASIVASGAGFLTDGDTVRVAQ
jgi:HlyD family secretion protein